MKRSLDQLIEVAQKAIEIGNRLIITSRPHTVTEKTDRDTYTDVDIDIERQVRAHLMEVTPEIGFAGEEEGFTSGSDKSHYWALDPIDGTANFVHGIPLSAVQIALIRNEEAIVSAIGLPYMEKNYWAAQGWGAFVNNVQIQVSGATDLTRSIVSIGDYATGDKAEEKNRQRIAVTTALVERVERIRMLGSAAHDFAWLAEGNIDAVVILSNNALDVQPGVLIAREAGGSVVDASGKEHHATSSATIAAAPAIVEEIVGLTVQALGSK